MKPLKNLNVYNFQLLIPIENIPMNQQIVLCPTHYANEICSKENNLLVLLFWLIQTIFVKTLLMYTIRISYLDTKKSAHASRTLFNCKKAAPTISIWTFWLSILTVPLYAKFIKLSNALKMNITSLNIVMTASNTMHITNIYCGSISFIVISFTRLSAISCVNMA